MGYGTVMDGISFIVRVRNEEQTLEQSLRSLKGLTIPHEIIVILHLCTDKSKEIAESLQNELPIRIVEFNKKLSRAGYENMATDATSEHSMVNYCNWCFSHALYRWTFKWDADFIGNESLCEYLNSKTWDTQPSTKIFFNAKSVDTDNCEGYLFTGNFTFGKHYFWEYHDTPNGWNSVYSDVTIEHLSKLSNYKSYWNEEPWFMSEGQEESIVRTRYEILQMFCGDEPIGHARASDPANNGIHWMVLQHEAFLRQKGINPTR